MSAPTVKQAMAMTNAMSIDMSGKSTMRRHSGFSASPSTKVPFGAVLSRSECLEQALS